MKDMEDVGKMERREVEGIYQGVVWSTYIFRWYLLVLPGTWYMKYRYAQSVPVL
jgi:hypothetical protein